MLDNEDSPPRMHWRHTQDRLVTARLRDLIYAAYPGLNAEGRIGTFHRRLMQCLVFSDFMELETGRTIVPYQTLLGFMGIASQGDERTSDFLDAFHAYVMPIRYTQWDHRQGRARKITPLWSEAFESELTEALREMVTEPDRRDVHFVSGKPRTRRSIDKEKQDNEDYYRRLIQDIDPDHPARELIDLLNTEGQSTIRHVYRRNRPALGEAWTAMPTALREQAVQKRYAARLLAHLDATFSTMCYGDSERTARVSARGVSLNLLPTALRKVALSGTVAFDLKSAQLAIVEKLYGCPRLRTFLESEASIWKELMRALDAGEEHKPIFKRTIYSIVFGMEERNLKKQLSDGKYRVQSGRHQRWSDYNPGVGKEKAARFFEHPLIAELLERRVVMTARVQEKGGMHDAFGRWIMVDEGRMARQVLASVAQSHEVNIMLAIVPWVKATQDMTIVSFLHDGVYIHFANATKRDRQIQLLERTVQRRADELGFLTRFEWEAI